MIKVLAGGCFNKIHPGHIYFLNKAKALGYLVVVLTHDKNNKKSYAVPAKERKKQITALKIADEVVIGHPTDYSKTVETIKPDIIALGYDQELPEGLNANRIKIARIMKFRNYSTRKLL
ncbi:MAG: adenylyltransferase/cytidyltransferase family protein [Candidatus Aenigmarchaeota archaeon]|nr:adenylyltransferase/cytidyltransferase family protein [Candidatus Aenigmarchaeota archaeon]